ncbi:uncharacterized protein B0I36DRAFT_353854 [Microdochium trichocladiopsis]|uniref:Secreted protein n=1 Tax=Microdochium trichocladiopsis TaxID=1682393 RepID=A0A9P8XVX1_9PEZI|nr:uncharacterized protein B0I36DRAFT_353854 [Microdochium trichocladiopsis]KAH7021155.1 hypothetical protein B0I36DRAFT_353854 [Microdochium trichocladiopsis]
MAVAALWFLAFPEVCLPAIQPHVRVFITITLANNRHVLSSSTPQLIVARMIRLTTLYHGPLSNHSSRVRLPATHLVPPPVITKPLLFSASSPSRRCGAEM